MQQCVYSLDFFSLNIIANEEILHPIGVPLLVGAMLFFLTLGIAQSEHTDAKVAETNPRNNFEKITRNVNINAPRFLNYKKNA